MEYLTVKWGTGPVVIKIFTSTYAFLKKKKDKLLPAEPPVPYYNSQNINKKGKNNMVKENFAPIG